MRLLLDCNVLGKVIHPRVSPIQIPRIARLLSSGKHALVVPEIADYELRRKLLHLKLYDKDPQKVADATESLKRLNEFAALTDYLPLTTGAMQKAASLWAIARKNNLVSEEIRAVECDLVLAAQALDYRGAVFTTNRSDFLLYGCEILEWEV